MRSLRETIPVRRNLVVERAIFRKALLLVSLCALIGVLDGSQAKFYAIGNFSREAGILYQVGFMVAAMVAAYVSLYDRSWGRGRNLTNLVMAIPIAMLSDNVSIDVQTLRPYLVIIPSWGFQWREGVFGHTILSPVASWVNQQTLTSGLIDGYLLGIGVAVGYLVMQILWSRAGGTRPRRDGRTLGSISPNLVFAKNRKT